LHDNHGFCLRRSGTCPSSRGDYYGVADLSSARDFIRARGGNRVAGYTRAVVMGIWRLDEIVNLLEDKSDGAGSALYRHNSYDVINAALDGTVYRKKGLVR